MSVEPFTGEIQSYAFNFAPKGWAACNGQMLPISQNQALYALLGINFGGDGRTTFALPNLQGRTPMHMGGNYPIGTQTGQALYALALNELPGHNHPVNVDAATAANSNGNTPGGRVLGQSVGRQSSGTSFNLSVYSANATNLATMAPAAVAQAGANQAHENRQPYLTLNTCIALQGYFPSRS